MAPYGVSQRAVDFFWLLIMHDVSTDVQDGKIKMLKWTENGAFYSDAQ